MLREAIIEGMTQAINGEKFPGLRQTLSDVSIGIEERMEELKRAYDIIWSVSDSLNEMDNVVRSHFQGVQGPFAGQHAGTYFYRFAAPVEYTDELVGFEDDLRSYAVDGTEELLDVHFNYGEDPELIIGLVIEIALDDLT